MKKLRIFVSVSVILIIGLVMMYNPFLRQSKVQTDNTAITPALTATPTPVVNRELKRWPAPTESPIMKSSEKAFTTLKVENKTPRRYLIENPIKIVETKTIQNTNGISLDLRYPQIEGLMDVSVQNRINDDLKDFADRLIKDSDEYMKDLKSVSLAYNVTANYNNILCMNIFTNIQLRDEPLPICQETILYELVNGKRLELKDIFNEKVEFPRELNRMIEEYILKRNLEEVILITPFKGIREGQNYELSHRSLNIIFDRNDEITFFMMINCPNYFSFSLARFDGIIDIYNRFANTGKNIYKSDVVKKKMIPNNFEEQFISREYNRENYRTAVHGRRFAGMKNTEMERKLNEICSYSGENEFRKLLPENLKMVEHFNDMPFITRNYHLTANYCDVVCIASHEYYSIPGVKTGDSEWHLTYNIVTGKQLGLKDIFKNQFNWKKAVGEYLRGETDKRGMKLADTDMSALLQKADFWFDEERLNLNIKPEENKNNEKSNMNKFSIPFEYFGEENLSIRE